MSQIHLVSAELVPVRATASEKAEMVSQLLFGEWVLPLATEGLYQKVRSLTDNYEGWVDVRMIAPLPEAWQHESRWTRLRQSHAQGRRITSRGEWPLLLTRGCLVPTQEGGGPGSLDFGFETLDFQGLMVERGTETSAAVVLQEAWAYLGAPYLWGGRSLCGIDCSGLTQLAYAFSGAKLPRDAWQQAREGREVSFSEVQAGDLPFFARNGKVVHVGVADGQGGLIHASGVVRWDFLTTRGIEHHQTGELTHELITIKRIY